MTTLTLDTNNQLDGTQGYPHFRSAEYKFRGPLNLLQVEEFTRTAQRTQESTILNDYNFIIAKGYKLILKAVKGEDMHSGVWKVSKCITSPVESQTVLPPVGWNV